MLSSDTLLHFFLQDSLAFDLSNRAVLGRSAFSMSLGLLLPFDCCKYHEGAIIRAINILKVKRFFRRDSITHTDTLLSI